MSGMMTSTPGVEVSSGSLGQGLGIAVGYFHTQWANMSVVQNTRVTAADYTSYCFTAPTDTRLGSNSGQNICGYYDLTPAGLAKGAAYQITQASNFGTPKDYYNGVDMGFNARWGKGALASGGVLPARLALAQSTRPVHILPTRMSGVS